MVSARPRRDNTLWQRSRNVRPQITASLIFVLSYQTKQAVLFVRYSGSEINAVAQRKKVPQAIKLKRRAIGSHQRLDKSAGHRIVIVDETISEIANPEFVFDQRESPWRAALTAR